MMAVAIIGQEEVSWDCTELLVKGSVGGVGVDGIGWVKIR